MALAMKAKYNSMAGNERVILWFKGNFICKVHPHTIGDLLSSLFRRNWKVYWIQIWFIPLWFPLMVISCILYFFQNFLPLYFSKQIKNGLGVIELLYLSMKTIVCYIHQQHLLTILFHENIFFSGNEVLFSWKISKTNSYKII